MLLKQTAKECSSHNNNNSFALKYSLFQKGDNAIHMAARTGRLGVIKRLKRKGDNLEKGNIVSKIFMTPSSAHSIVSLNLVKWAPSSEFVSSSIPSWQILTAHGQPFRGGRDLAFCLKVPLDSLLVRASSGGSGETARMRRLAWAFAARIGDKYQIHLTRSKWWILIKRL